MIAVVVSSANRCYYCQVAHGQAVRELSGDPALGELLVMNYRAAALTPRQRAMLDFAHKMTVSPDAIVEEDRAALRDAGFDDRVDLGHRGRGGVLQHDEPHGDRDRHDAERRIPREEPLTYPSRDLVAERARIALGGIHAARSRDEPVRARCCCAAAPSAGITQRNAGSDVPAWAFPGYTESTTAECEVRRRRAAPRAGEPLSHSPRRSSQDFFAAPDWFPAVTRRCPTSSREGDGPTRSPAPTVTCQTARAGPRTPRWPVCRPTTSGRRLPTCAATCASARRRDRTAPRP